MLRVLSDPTVEPERRDRMAVAAAPFVHPRLASVEAKVDTFGQVEVKMTREQLVEQTPRELDEAFREYEPDVKLPLEKPVIEHRSEEGAATLESQNPVPENDFLIQTLRITL